VNSSKIAIIGMAGRFPGANDIQQFWSNLVQGVETIHYFNEQELINAGLPSQLLQDQSFVPARGVLDHIEAFDAGFFSYSPREAELLDPQQRIFLECAWAALEDAGYDPYRCSRAIGVYAGCNQNTYQLFHVFSSIEERNKVHGLAIYADKDFLSTRVSYNLNLHGPSLTVQSACSTSLVCIHMACQSLLNMECDMALAGGVSVVFPQVGYLYQQGGVFSPDGHCRAFDQNATGTLASDGVGVVLLKRLEDAQNDGDHIYAVILGTAVNNDGKAKASYAAPSVDGQMRVITETLGVADIPSESIGYVETHGTGTVLGDLVELTALKRVLVKGDSSACRIGSLKPNIGHLDQAAGVASLIKAALVVQQGLIPPSLNVKTPHPDLAPLELNTHLSPWPEQAFPRRAGVSSFGFGGTNAHVILEQPPEKIDKAVSSRPWFLLVYSARTENTLQRYRLNLVQYLETQHDSSMADIAYVLQAGRSRFGQGQFVVAQSREEASALLTSNKASQVVYDKGEFESLPVYFLFPGQGTQYLNMGKSLYNSEPIFKKHIDKAAAFMQDFGIDIYPLLFPLPEQEEFAQGQINQTQYAQPLLFIVEYALARLWMAYGVTPSCMIGHSLGEYVAACISEVFTFKDTLRLLIARGKLTQQLTNGAMLAVNVSADKLRTDVTLQLSNVSLAAINSTCQCVLAGDDLSIAALEKELSLRGFIYQRLPAKQAFHSVMVEPILEQFTAIVSEIPRSRPIIPFISNVTGKLITPEEAMSPIYWAKHMRQTVLFADGIDTLLNHGSGLFLEVGPGYILSNLVKKHLRYQTKHHILQSLGQCHDSASDFKLFLSALGTLWLQGVDIQWDVFYQHEQRSRVSLPTYPFERDEYFLPSHFIEPTSLSKQRLDRQPIQQWFYVQGWESAASSLPLPIAEENNWLLVTNQREVVEPLKSMCAHHHINLNVMFLDETYLQLSENHFNVCCNPQDFQKVLQPLARRAQPITKIVHFVRTNDINEHVSLSIGSMLALLQELHNDNKVVDSRTDLLIVTMGIQDILGVEQLVPHEAPILGISRVIPLEFPHLYCKTVDFQIQAPWPILLKQLFNECRGGLSDTTVAYRGSARFRQHYQPLTLSPLPVPNSQFSSASVLLICGGLGEMGLSLARYIAQTYQSKLVLTGRSDLPEQAAWDDWIATHPPENPKSKLLKQLKMLIQSGSEVVYFKASVDDLSAMRNVFNQTIASFGGIDGIIHAAGISGARVFSSIAETTAATLQMHFEAKVDGVNVLMTLVREVGNIPFCLLQSSLLSTIGGPGCAAYASANTYMDYIVKKLNRDDNQTHWMSVNWDAWLTDNQTLHVTGLTHSEAHQAFEQLLVLENMPQVLVSVCKLNTRINQVQSMVKPLGTDIKKYERPALQSAYTAPQSEVELLLADIWQKILGINEIGVDDDFFELGGHSLSAMQIMASLKNILPIQMDMGLMMKHATISQLAMALEDLLIAKLEGITDEEAEAMLQ
jgi:acyl transferase domain-containing protein/acyl carrier protein